ncbi:hypothetical protein PG2T_02320 [Immundisolibacter cernigliae]|uniref:Uncharacterized protein n=1 Tax=Immundisolibacter cernigliae TaxID=1810504 RepID=A0A1B1YQX6_9GAMM|nr:hypothetical protein PG2T_02320 [Immundisolibacter cernigliae]
MVRDWTPAFAGVTINGAGVTIRPCIPWPDNSIYMNSLYQASGIVKNPTSKTLAVVYIAFVGALIAWAVDIWHLRCEGFGCTGVGVAWLGWVGLFLTGLVLGLVLRTLSSPGAFLARSTKLAFWLQVATGGTLFVLWVSRNAV